MVSKSQPSKNVFYFGWRPFWKVGKNYVSHARISWGFFWVDTSTTVNSKLLELVCIQFCLSSPYIWALLTRLFRDINEKNHYANSTQNPNVIHLHEHTCFNSYVIVYISTYMSTCAHFKSTVMTPNYVKPIVIKCGLGAPYSNRD